MFFLCGMINFVTHFGQFPVFYQPRARILFAFPRQSKREDSLRIADAVFFPQTVIFYQIVCQVLHLVMVSVLWIFINLFADPENLFPAFLFGHIIYQTGPHKFTGHFCLKYSQSLLQKISVQAPADLRHIPVFCFEQHFIVFINILIHDIHFRDRLRIFKFFFQCFDPAYRTVKTVAAAHADRQGRFFDRSDQFLFFCISPASFPEIFFQFISPSVSGEYVHRGNQLICLIFPAGIPDLVRLFSALWFKIICKPSADLHLLALQQFSDRIHLGNRIPVAALHIHIQMDRPVTFSSPDRFRRSPEVDRLIQIYGNDLRKFLFI